MEVEQSIRLSETKLARDSLAFEISPVHHIIHSSS